MTYQSSSDNKKYLINILMNKWSELLCYYSVYLIVYYLTVF